MCLPDINKRDRTSSSNQARATSRDQPERWIMANDEVDTVATTVAATNHAGNVETNHAPPPELGTEAAR